jgi:hypothetical protein
MRTFTCRSTFLYGLNVPVTGWGGAEREGRQDGECWHHNPAPLYRSARSGFRQQDPDHAHSKPLYLKLKLSVSTHKIKPPVKAESQRLQWW